MIPPTLACVGSDEPVDVELPNQWLWDIIDEFIYQASSYWVKGRHIVIRMIDIMIRCAIYGMFGR